MRNDEHGPSWFDVAAAIEDFHARRGFRPTIQLTAPFKNPVTQRFVSWGASVAKPPPLGKAVGGRVVWAYWGQGGAHRTAPGAVYRALLDLDTALAEEEAIAQQRMPF